MRALSVAVLVLAGTALAAQAPPPQPPLRAATGDRAGATAVVVDVVVRDSRGRPVVTLGADDFEIYEDGVRQPIGSFRPPMAATATAAPASAADVPTPAGPVTQAEKPVPREPAVMAVVFDRLSLESRRLAVDAMRRYVGDRRETANIVGVFDIDLAPRILQPFTRDASAIRASLAKVSATRPGLMDPMHVTDMRGPVEQGLAGGPASGRPADDLTVSMNDLFDGTLGDLQAEYGGSVTVHGLAAIVAALSGAPGRKSILMFSQGVSLSRDGDPRFYALIDQANRANVAVYTVDAVGLRAGSYNLLAGRYAAEATRDATAGVASPQDFATVARGAPEVGLSILANATGGQPIDSTNDLFRAFPRLDEDLRSYYALTYVPSREQPDGKFHRVQVKVKRPGLSARARSGYTSLPVAAATMPVLGYEAPALARLESSPLPNELPILARAFVFPVSHEAARVPVIVSIQSRSLDYARDEAAGTFTAEAVVLMRVRDAEGRIVHKASEQYTVSGRLEKLEASRAGEMLFYRQPRLAPGVYTLETIVMDSRSGKAGVRVSTIDVARASDTALRMGTPFLVRRAEVVAEPQRDAGNPLYFGELLLYPNVGQPLSKATDKELALGFTAYGGHDGPVTATLQLLKSGHPVTTVPLTLGAADRHGRINQISKLPLEALEPGNYELRVTVTAGAQQVTRAIPFAIAAS